MAAVSFAAVFSAAVAQVCDVPQAPCQQTAESAFLPGTQAPPVSSYTRAMSMYKLPSVNSPYVTRSASKVFRVAFLIWTFEVAGAGRPVPAPKPHSLASPLRRDRT